MKPHGNSLDNMNLHHLYEIFRIVDADTFKYGISTTQSKPTVCRKERENRFLK
jgi:hypothetical protein